MKTQSKHTLRDYFIYLNDLRESGITNMFGARPYLMEEFGLEKQEASKILSSWMKTFSREITIDEQVAKATGSNE